MINIFYNIELKAYTSTYTFKTDSYYILFKFHLIIIIRGIYPYIQEIFRLLQHYFVLLLNN